ncbi:ATP-binding protein [Sphaerisporangium flaviroseum]|uniref:ATP-binding protein n=1 Tax=Sphaerisporangium flaviroseum TaxID=509199 RepID=A0ABP7HQH2_9ACTN
MKVPAEQGTPAVTRLVTATFPGTHDQAAQARAFVREVLGHARYHRIAGDAELLASELFTNAARHSRSRDTGKVTIMVQAGDVVRVEVVDDGSADRLPRVMTPDPSSLGGRGLFLVRALSARFGVRKHEAGTTTWFELIP